MAEPFIAMNPSHSQPAGAFLQINVLGIQDEVIELFFSNIQLIEHGI
jgi:hypothetical protein